MTDMAYRTTTDGLTVEMIDSIESSADYEWDVFALLRGSDGLLYTASDSGCSCNWFGDNDLHVEPVKSWQEAAAQAQKWYGTDDSEAMQFIERLTRLSPPAKE